MSADVAQEFAHRFSLSSDRFGLVREALHELPVIDLRPFTEGGSDAEKRRVALQLREASINIGFFFLEHHGVDPQTMDMALAWAARFFDLPRSAKEKLHQNRNGIARGWFPAEFENLTATADSRPDIKESFNFSRDIGPGDPLFGAPLMGPNVFPAEHVLPGFEAFMRDYIRRIQGVAEHLLHAFALSLELDEYYFDDLHTHPFVMARLNYYPPVSETDIVAQRWSCGAHTDYEGLTLLLQDDTGGLEVYNSAGEWISVPVRPGMFVVNFGDLMSVWTNDLYPATPHRVRNISGRKRYSLPYFYGPGRHATITCLETCAGEGNPPRYSPTDVISHCLARMKRTRGDEAVGALASVQR